MAKTSTPKYQLQNGYFPDTGLISKKDLLNFRKEISQKEVKNVTIFIPVIVSDAIIQEKNKFIITDAMDNILKILKNLEDVWDLIIIGVDGASLEEFNTIKNMYKTIDKRFQIIWNDSPEMTKFYKKFSIDKMPPGQRKGRNFWTGIGYSLAVRPYNNIATHDGDIRPEIYDEEFVLRMIYATHPSKSIDFGKAYYARVISNKEGNKNKLLIRARLQRLMMIPMIESLMESKFAENATFRKYLQFLSRVKYQTSGEITLSNELARNISIEGGYRQEISMLKSAFILRDEGFFLKQFDLGVYDHKHQIEGYGDVPKGLQKMSIEIWKAMFTHAFLISKGYESIEKKNYKEFREFINEKNIEDVQKAFLPLANNCVKAYSDFANSNKSEGWDYSTKEEYERTSLFANCMWRAQEVLLLELNTAIDNDKEMEADIQPLPRWKDISEDTVSKLGEIVEKYSPRKKQ